MLQAGDIAWDICSVLSYYVMGVVAFTLRKKNWIKMILVLCVSSVVFFGIDMIMYIKTDNDILMLIRWSVTAVLEIMIIVCIASLFEEDVWRTAVWLMIMQVISSVLMGMIAQFIPPLARAIHENALQRNALDLAAYVAASVAQMLIPFLIACLMRPIRKKVFMSQWGMRNQVYKRFIQIYIIWVLVQALLRTRILEAVEGKEIKVGVLLFSFAYLILFLVAVNILLYYINREYGGKVKTEYMVLSEISRAQEKQYANAVRENRALDEIRKVMKDYSETVAGQAEKQKMLRKYAEGITKENEVILNDVPLSGNLVLDAACASLYQILRSKEISFELVFKGSLDQVINAEADGLMELLLYLRDVNRIEGNDSYVVLTLEDRNENLFVNVEGEGVICEMSKKLRKLRRTIRLNGGEIRVESDQTSFCITILNNITRSRT